uniref:Putative ovule protein n=1 Tax=Solanum chacoense TaxID=4108 RepID=A0A0V0IA24_SOLCH
MHSLFSYSYYSLYSVLYTMTIWMFSSVDVQSNMLLVELLNYCLAWLFWWVYEILGKVPFYGPSSLSHRQTDACSHAGFHSF